MIASIQNMHVSVKLWSKQNDIQFHFTTHAPNEVIILFVEYMCSIESPLFEDIQDRMLTTNIYHESRRMNINFLFHGKFTSNLGFEYH